MKEIVKDGPIYSYDDIFKIRESIQSRRLLLLQEKESSSSNTESMCLTFTINALTSVMDEITDLLNK